MLLGVIIAAVLLTLLLLLLLFLLVPRTSRERFLDDGGRIVNADGLVLADDDACIIRTDDGKLAPMAGFLQLGRGPTQGTSCVYRRSDYESGVMDDELSQCTVDMVGKEASVKAGVRVQDFEGTRSCVLRFDSPPTPAALDAFQANARDGALERTMVYAALHAKYVQQSEVLNVLTADVATQRAYLAKVRAKRSELATNMKIATDARAAAVQKKAELAQQLERQLASITSSIERAKTLKDPGLVAAEEERRRAMSQARSESAARPQPIEEPPRSFEHPALAGRFLAVRGDGELMLSSTPLRLIIEYGFQGMRAPQKFSALRNVDGGKRMMHSGAAAPVLTERTSESNAEISWLLYNAPGGGVAIHAPGDATWIGYSNGDTLVMCSNEFDPRVVHWKVQGPPLLSPLQQSPAAATKPTGIFGKIGMSIRNPVKGDGPLLSKVARLIASYASQIQGAAANSASVCTPSGAADMRAKDFEAAKAIKSCAEIAQGFDATMKSQASDMRKQYGWSGEDTAAVVTGSRSVMTDVLLPMVCNKDGTVDPGRAADLSLAINRAIQCDPGTFDERAPALGVYYSTPDPAAAKVLQAIQERSVDKIQTAVCSTLASTLPQKKAQVADFLQRNPFSCKKISDAFDESVKQSATVTDLRDAWNLLSERVCGPDGNMDPVAATTFIDGAFAAFC